MSIVFDLKEIVQGEDRQTNFTTMLLKLIFKADSQNRTRLKSAFPEEVEAVEHYVETGEIVALLKETGANKGELRPSSNPEEYLALCEAIRSKRQEPV